MRGAPPGRAERGQWGCLKDSYVLNSCIFTARSSRTACDALAARLAAWNSRRSCWLSWRMIVGLGAVEGKTECLEVNYALIWDDFGFSSALAFSLACE